MDRQLVEYAARWREVSPQLEAMRDQELVSTPLPIAMEQLAGMVESAVFLEPLSNTSGMVEMQRILALLRE
ncbi:MAG: hypothetical protein IPG63_02275 [Xanthomonadales bacterium]|nr:hypothetical protein [Xanthomonadales bacterium]